MDITRTRTNGSTPHQRLFARSLMNRLELPTHIVTVMHRDIFRSCSIDWRDGQGMDELLETLTREQIGALIAVLQKRVGDDEENDNA